MWRETYLAALHRERLAGARLAICEYADVVSIRATLRELRDLLEDLGLGGMWLKDLGKRPSMGERDEKTV